MQHSLPTKKIPKDPLRFGWFAQVLMLEKPDLPDQLILSHVQEAYGLPVRQATFLPLGADAHTAVYRIVTAQGTTYFLKLRSGDFAEITVTLPKFLQAQGMREIIAPLETRDQNLWGSLGDYKTILYPFIEGKDGYQVALTDRQWLVFGAALKQIHTTQVPIELARQVRRETFAPQWRAMVRNFLEMVEQTTFADPLAAKFARSMQAKRGEIQHMVERGAELGRLLAARPPDFVLCHSDIHPGNLLIPENEANDSEALYIVDWDAPIFAPKERDLLLIGGSPVWNEDRVETLFYQGYGPTEIDREALAYYRYERIIEDIAVESEQVLLSVAGDEDREQETRYFLSNFAPGHEYDLALEADR